MEPIKSPLWFENRACESCALRQNCSHPVPGTGPLSAQVMLIGESPGADEDKTGMPFQGRAGKYLDYLLESVGLSRSRVWISNTVKCRPADNRDPLPDEVNTCAPQWLDREIELVNPKIIVTLGSFASKHLLKDPEFSVERSHGIPKLVNNRLVLPVYHPASGLHQTRNMRFIQGDFGVLGKLLEGANTLDLIPKDPYPEPKYQEVTDVQTATDLLSQTRFALDTETVRGPAGEARVWSVQVSSEAGTGYFIPVSIFGQGDSVVSLNGIVQIPEASEVIVHNYLYDARFLRIPNPLDSMIAAWLLQLPMGLKELAYRYCGMEMASYAEYVLPHQRQKSLEYLRMAAQFIHEMEVPANPKAKNPKKFKRVAVGYPDPPEIADWEWSNKEGGLVQVVKRPHNITKKILDRIVMAESNPDYDVYGKWYDIDPRERAVVEDLMGPMPEADLRDAPLSQAVYYATRDPDATWRWWTVAEQMLREQDLWDVFRMEMGHTL